MAGIQSVAGSESTIEQDLAASDLVFHGVVTEVNYVKAEDGTPHAFVTYHVKKVIRGSIPDRIETVTLRFIGGPLGDGSFFMMSKAPNFAAGDEDVLFVRGNGSDGCPLVSCLNGRLRILDDRVYQGIATPVINIKKGKIIAKGAKPGKLLEYRFPPPPFETYYARQEVKEAIEKACVNQKAECDYKNLKAAYEKHVPKQIILRRINAGDSGEGAVKQEPDDPIRLKVLIDALLAANKTVPEKPAPFVSVDPKAPFAIQLPDPESPAKQESQQISVLPYLGATAEEMEQYADEQHNPVIK
jgi:hypothetical protein